jgi:hypothetical protein
MIYVNVDVIITNINMIEKQSYIGRRISQLLCQSSPKINSSVKKKKKKMSRRLDPEIRTMGQYIEMK